jgi:N-6 DNA Methylase
MPKSKSLPPASYTTCKAEFVKKLNAIAHHKRSYEVFRDWLEATAIACHQMPYLSGHIEPTQEFHDLEAKYKKIEAQYKPEEWTKFAELLGVTMMALGDRMGDFLGEVYMQCEFGSDRAGQFFTPWAISILMAEMTVTDLKGKVEAQGIITISDPACGAGGMLIATAEAMLKDGIDPRTHAQFSAVDVDRNCFNMAYIQLSLLGLQAIVTHGNTLSLVVYEERPTMQLRFFQQWRLEKIQEQKAIAAMRDLIMGAPEVEDDPPILQTFEDSSTEVPPPTVEAINQTQVAPKRSQGKKALQRDSPGQLPLF